MTKKIKLEFTESQVKDIVSDFIPKMDFPYIGRDYTVIVNSIEKQLKEIGNEGLLEENLLKNELSTTKKIKLEFTEKQVRDIVSDYKSFSKNKNSCEIMTSIEKQLKDMDKSHFFEKNK